MASSSSKSASEMYACSSQATQSCIDKVNQLFSHLEQPPTPEKTSAPPIVSQLTDISKKLLMLKQCQREIGLHSGKVKSNQVTKQREQVKANSLTLENLVYQRFFLLKDIDKSSQWTIPQLLQMAREESAQEQTDDSEERTATESIDAFLGATTATGGGAETVSSASSYSHLDPRQHTLTLEKLQHQLKERKNLQTKLSNGKTQLQSLQQSLQGKQSFLKSLPLKLKAVQQSTTGLEEAFNKFRSKNDTTTISNKNDLNSLSLIGSKRQERLELARELSAPLYTLYIQLQCYLDGNKDTTKDFSLCTVNIVKQTGGGSTAVDVQEVQSLLERHSKGVTLTMSTPTMMIGSNASGGGGITWKSNRVTLMFSHFVKLNLVSVHAMCERGGSSGRGGSPSSLWMNSLGSLALLEQLFLGDDGRELPPGSCANVVYKDSQGEQEDEDERKNQPSQPKDIDMEDLNDAGDPSLYYGNSQMLSTKQQALYTIRMALKTDSRGPLKNTGIELHPYHWLQYASGLHYAMPNPQGLHATTTLNSKKCNAVAQLTIESTIKAVMQQLDRRIRSHTTLAALVHLLETKRPHPIPIHPSIPSNETNGKICDSRVVSWVEKRDVKEPDMGTTMRYFKVTIQRKSSNLVCEVEIDAQYPSIPPLWSLQPNQQGQSKVAQTSSNHGQNTESSLLPSLYDSILGQIESKVNTLSTAPTLFGQRKELCEKDVQDWILVHQLREIVTSWDAYQESSVLNSASLKRKDNGVSPVLGTRKRRGRERRPVS